MSKLTERIHERRFGKDIAKSKTKGLAAKGMAAGIFLGIAALFLVSGLRSDKGMVGLIALSIFALLFATIAVLIVLEKEIATKFGIASIGLFCLYLFYDALVSGSVRIGFVWLIVLFLAAKKLVDYENYMSSKDQLSKRKFEYGEK